MAQSSRPYQQDPGRAGHWHPHRIPVVLPARYRGYLLSRHRRRRI